MNRTTMAIILLFIAGLLLIAAAMSFRSSVERIDTTIYSIDNLQNPSYIDANQIILYVEDDGISTYNLTLS